MHNFISKGDFCAGEKKSFDLKKKAFCFKKKPLSATSACLLLCAESPSPVVPIWGLFGKQKKLGTGYSAPNNVLSMERQGKRNYLFEQQVWIW